MSSSEKLSYSQSINLNNLMSNENLLKSNIDFEQLAEIEHSSQ